MATLRQAGFLFLLAAVAATLSAFLHPGRPAWYFVKSVDDLRWQISLEEAKSLATTEDVLWVDARSRAKFEESHLPGAVLLNAEEWGDLMFQNMDTLQTAMNRPVIVYCDGDRCAKSEDVASRLRELLGLEPVYVLKGDWKLLK